MRYIDPWVVGRWVPEQGSPPLDAGSAWSAHGPGRANDPYITVIALHIAADVLLSRDPDNRSVSNIAIYLRCELSSKS